MRRRLTRMGTGATLRPAMWPSSSSAAAAAAARIVDARATRASLLSPSSSTRAARAARSTIAAAKKKAKTTRKAPQRGTHTREEGAATHLERAALGDVEENHALEQFFYDDETTARLLRVAKGYAKPVFMCNPSLARAWEREVGTEYMLLDCDLRFKKMDGFKAFDLRRPVQVRFAYDVVFVDPPFANVTPAEVKRAVDLIAATDEQRGADVYVAYNSDREDVLLESFTGLARMGRALGYQSVKEGMQQKIHLYGPAV